jgi:hypothetical protein
MDLLLEIALAAMMSARADSAIGGAAQWATRVWGLFFKKKMISCSEWRSRCT